MPKFLDTVDDVVAGANDLLDGGRELYEDAIDFVDGFLGSKGGFQEDTYVQSIRKASRLYGLKDDKLSKVPRLAFQFYVRINYDGEFHEYVNNFSESYSEHPNYVKSVTVPVIDVETEKLLSYNRYRINQTKLNYSPVEITFRDIIDGRTSIIWNMYSDFYFKDGNPKKPDSVINEPVLNEMHESEGEFGYGNLNYSSGTANRQLFKSIEIFQFYGKGSFNKVTLHNPKITKFSHSQLSVESSDLVDVNYTFEYEWAEYQYDFNTRLDEPEIYENFFSENKVDHLDFQIWDNPIEPPSTGLIADIEEIMETVEDVIEVVDTVKGVVKTVAGVVTKVSSTVNQLQMDILGKDEPPYPLPDGRNLSAIADNIPTSWSDVKRITRKSNRPPQDKSGGTTFGQEPIGPGTSFGSGITPQLPGI